MKSMALPKQISLSQVKETVLMLGLSVLMPYLAHLIPSSAGFPAGARWLAMFYAPFIAVALFKPGAGLITAVSAPVLNSLLTGLPAKEIVPILTFELLLYTIICIAFRRYLYIAIIAPGAYVLSKIGTSFIFGIFSAGWLISSLHNALPGLLALFLLNIVVICFREQAYGPSEV